MTALILMLDYREESEKVSELKSVSGSNTLPYGTLASGSEGIKEAISSFDDALVFRYLHILHETDVPFLGGSPILRTNVFLPTFMTLIQRKARPF